MALYRRRWIRPNSLWSKCSQHSRGILNPPFLHQFHTVRGGYWTVSCLYHYPYFMDLTRAGRLCVANSQGFWFGKLRFKCSAYTRKILYSAVTSHCYPGFPPSLSRQRYADQRHRQFSVAEFSSVMQQRDQVKLGSAVLC